jgi:methionyl-tRNA synthetase
MKKVLITSALPYANGPLHFGHIAGAYLPADCYARFQRLRGNDVLYICGSDEHGVAITLSAELVGRTPKEHVDLFHEIIKSFFKKLNFSFDHYSRTTWPKHAVTTQQFFHDLLQNGYIEEKVTDQLYSEADRKFLADRYVVGTCPKCKYEEARGDECGRCGASFEATDLIHPRSKLSGTPLVRKATKHWFLRFDLFKDKLKKWIATKHWKPNVVNFAENYIEDLHPRAITRDSDWGIPVPLPEAKGKVFYVWFDAPIGYISATQEWAELKKEPEAWKKYWFDPETFLVQFIGKDNIPFHAVFFPAMCMGQNQPYKLVDELPANEFYNLEGRQFSKSEGWIIDLETFFDKFSADQIRYVIAANAPETHDSEFSWKDFQSRCNAELLGKYGNLVNRVLVFASQHCEGKIPPRHALSAQDSEFIGKIHALVEEIARAYKTFHLRRASQLVMELAQTANAYFDAKKPWVAAKSSNTRADMENTLSCCIECLKLLALVSAPIMPHTAEKVWNLLGLTSSLHQQKWKEVVEFKIPAHQTLPKITILFQKIEDEVIEAELVKLEKLKAQKAPSQPSNTKGVFSPSRPYEHLKSEISIEEVKKLDLRVGKILSAERIPKSNRLLKLQVDLGFEERTIVSGIGDKFPELGHLINKKVLIVANLKPAKLMGVESQGMLLTAEYSEGLELPSFTNAHPGDPIS